MSSHPYMTDHYEEERRKGRVSRREEHLKCIAEEVKRMQENISDKESDQEVEELYFAFINRKKVFRNHRLIKTLG